MISHSMSDWLSTHEHISDNEETSTCVPGQNGKNTSINQKIESLFFFNDALNQSEKSNPSRNIGGAVENDITVCSSCNMKKLNMPSLLENGKQKGQMIPRIIT